MIDNLHTCIYMYLFGNACLGYRVQTQIASLTILFFVSTIATARIHNTQSAIVLTVK